MNGALLRLIRRGRLRSEDGANAVEFALVLVPLMLILFGILSGGILFNRQLNLTHAAREGARFAVTLAVEGDEWFDDVIDRTIQSAAGDIIGSGISYVCVGLVGAHDAADYAEHGVRPSHERFAEQPDGACFEDDRGSEVRVQVQIVVLSNFNAIFFNRTGIPVTGQAVARYEALER